MRIGIDCRMYSSQFTGIGRYVFELVENLQKIDFQNDYYLFFNEPEYSNFQASNPKFHKVLAKSKHYSLTEQTHFLRVVNCKKLHLMHFTHFNRPILYNRPSVVTIHDLILHFYPGQKMSSFLHRMAYNITIRTAVNKAQKIIAVSKCTANDLQSVLKIPQDKIRVIYEGVNHDFKVINNEKLTKHTLSKYGINKDFIIYSGVWRDHKNVKGLLRAFALLREKRDIQLVITGKKDSIYAQGIFALAKELHLLSHESTEDSSKPLVFPGLVSEDELILLLNAAKAYIFPSFYEGFGLPPLEAMQCGTPVVASNTSCIPEICENNAIYFDPLKPEDIAEKIENLLSNSELQTEMNIKGLNHVKKFSWQKMAEETHKLYIDAAGK